MKTKRIFNRLASVVSLLLFISINLSAITVTWVGGSGHWHQPIKWDTGQVPTANDDVIIPSGFARVDFPNARARTLLVESGATFLVNVNGELIFENQSNVTCITNEGLMGNFGLIRTENIINSNPQQASLKNEGQYFVLPGGKIELINNVNAKINNDFNALFNNHGSIVADISIANDNEAISNSGEFENRVSGVIYITGGDRGIYNNSGQNTIFRNRGKIVVYDSDGSGIRNNYNSGNISFENLQSGSISLSGCRFRMGNSINDGVITVSKYHPPYSFAAINSGENTTNNGIINLYYNRKGLFINQTGNFENFGSINMYGSTESSISITGSSGLFVNHPEGYVYLENAMTGSSLHNDGIIISKSSAPHTTTVTNNGIIEDYNGTLPSSTINNKVVIRPIQGPLINGSPTSNFLDKVSLGGITIGTWRDAIFGGNTSGVYNGSSNVFTPNFHGHGEGDLYADMQIAGTNNSALVNIKIINAWNSVAQDKDEEQIMFREAKAKSGNVVCYPNPTSGQVTIDWRSMQERPDLIRVFDVTGRLVLEKMIGQNEDEMETDLNTLSDSGMYLYRLISNRDIVASGKIMKGK